MKSIFFLTASLTELLSAGADNMDPGRVLNVASVAGISAQAEDSGLGAEGTGLWSYGASKAAAIQCVAMARLRSDERSLTKLQSTTLARRNITANGPSCS